MMRYINQRTQHRFHADRLSINHDCQLQPAIRISH